MRLLPLLILALLFCPGGAVASWEWTKYCSAVSELSPGRAYRDYFVYGVKFDALADKLRPRSLSPMKDAKKVPVTFSDGEKYQITMGTGFASSARQITLHDREHQVSHVSFNHYPEEQRLFLTLLETDPYYAGKSANEMLLRTILAVHPETKTVGAHLSWVNFKIIAETLSGGKDMSDMDKAQDAVAAAIANSNRDALLAAIDSSPTGRQMLKLGFKVNGDAELRLMPADRMSAEGPVLRIQWTRP